MHLSLESNEPAENVEVERATNVHETHNIQL